MAGKPPAAKKKTAKPSRRHPAAGNAAPKRAPAKAAWFVCVQPLGTLINGSRPKQAGARGPFDRFEDARRAAIEDLIAHIETAEEQLVRLKRAATLDDLRPQ